MKLQAIQITARNGRSYLEADLSDDGYESHIALDLTTVYFLTQNASTTKGRRTSRGPLTITRARRMLTAPIPGCQACGDPHGVSVPCGYRRTS